MGSQHASALTRFYDNAMPEPNSGCWLWLGYQNGTGYGQLRVNGKTEYAHRFALGLVRDVPKTAHVMHACDNRCCVNPEHLSIGNAQANMDDKVKKGRQARGERQGSSRLTATEVTDILRSALPQRALASKYGVSQGTIGFIKRGESWKHLQR